MTPTKIASVAIIGTGVVGGGIGTVYAFSPSKSETITKTTIKDKLTSEGLSILSDTKQDRWIIKLHTYTSKVRSSNAEIVLTGGDKWETLKAWCEGKLTDTFEEKNNNIYQDMKKICTVPSNEEKLVSARKELAKTQEDWGKRKAAYDQASDSEIIPSIEKNKPENQGQIEKWCETALKEEYQSESKGNYSLVAKWCVKDA